jgi:gluconate 2-dehydrogenase gamma chain
MTLAANWPVKNGGIDLSETPRFFTAEEWATIEAATARIYPSGSEVGAREAKVVRFIDRYLSGIDHVFASAGGEGFLAIGGRDAEAWRQRIGKLQATYRQGILRLDEISSFRRRAGFLLGAGAPHAAGHVLRSHLWRQ